MSADDLKIATFLFQNCSMGEKEPNKENKRMNEAEREMKRVLNRKGRENVQNPKLYYALFFVRAFAHAIAST